MTDQKQPDEAPQQVFVPVTATQPAEPEASEKEAKKTGEKKKDQGEGVPAGQIAAGGVGATVLGSYALASVVGPWGWAVAPAAVVVGGAGYVAYRRRKRKGSKSERRTEKVTTSKGSASTGRLGGLGWSRAGSPASGARGTRSSSARHASGGTSGGGRSGSFARPGGGSSRPGSRGGKGAGKPPSSGGGRPGSSSPRGGSTPRGSAPRGSSGRGGGAGPGSKGGGLFGRSGGRGRLGGTGGSDGLASSTKKKPGTPTTPSTGKPEAGRGGTRGGNMPNDQKRPGRFRRAGARVRDWADDKTGGTVSSGWKAARGQRGFNNRRRAARDAGGGGFVAGLVGLFAALFAGAAALAGRARPWADRHMDTVDPDAKKGRAGKDAPDQERPATGTGSGSGPQPKTTPNTDRPDQHKPNQAPNDAPTTGGSTMAGLPASQIAHDMTGAMARYEPADAWAVVAESKQWPDVSTQVAMSVKAYADRLESARFPLNPAIVGKLQEYFQSLAASRSIAEELHPLLQKAHAEDIAKQDAPRGDESKWNI